MRKYIKPASVCISLHAEHGLMLPASVNNSKYESVEGDSDYGTQFSNKGGWSSDSWDNSEE